MFDGAGVRETGGAFREKGNHLICSCFSIKLPICDTPQCFIAVEPTNRLCVPKLSSQSIHTYTSNTREARLLKLF